MWQAIAFVVAEILKLVIGKLLEPAKASDARGTLRVPVDAGGLLRNIEGSLRWHSTIHTPVPRDTALS